MDIKNFDAATYIVGNLRKIEYEIEMISKGNWLGVTIQGAYQKDDFVDAIRPAVLTELSYRRDALRAELEKLGVFISPSH
ncbi:hypothetical protein ACTUSX_04340 [Pantoea ananatis]|uniref:hypothetical protein n=1 Tax=Pantoea ananas TaxID=553 RepID=UPI003FA44A2B